MAFEQNVFISYAHIDDQPLTPGQQGWITRFHGTLDALLSMRLGRNATIWRDEKLAGNDVFSDEIVAQFRRTAALVSVLTTRYLNSDWCTRELREFCDSAVESGGLLVGNRSRVFKVIKTPVDSQAPLPEVMQQVLGYDFFTVKEGAPLELDPAYGQEYAQLYNQRVAKLAWDVAQLVKEMDAARRPPANPGAPAELSRKPVVYLAECSYDRKQAREVLDGELKRLGYTVLPDRRMPEGEFEYVAAVEGFLARSAVSIHLIGASYGAVPDGPSMKSVVVHQNELAVRAARRGGLTRIIWLPHGTSAGHAPHQAFIDALQRDAEAQFGADLITGDLEELRTAVHATLKKAEESAPATVGAGSRENAGPGDRLIYLICDEKDRKATVPIRKWCKQRGLDAALPAFEGDASQVRRANGQLLGECDAVLVFYGAGDEAWKRTVDNELKRVGVFRSGKPQPVRYTYLAEPRTRDKDDLLELEEPNLVNGLDGFDEAGMTRFVATLHSAAGGGA